jgi:hypothetical protein
VFERKHIRHSASMRLGTLVSSIALSLERHLVGQLATIL